MERLRGMLADALERLPTRSFNVHFRRPKPREAVACTPCTPRSCLHPNAKPAVTGRRRPRGSRLLCTLGLSIPADSTHFSGAPDA